MADEENSVPDDENDAPPPAPTWKPPATPDELNAIIEKRLQRERNRYKDYDDLKVKAARAEALDNELASETEKAVKAARDEERAKILSEATPRLVKAEFRAAAKGVLTKDQLDSLLEDVDLTRFVTPDGDVDEERITKKIAALAPPKDDDDAPRDRFPDLGGGKRGTASKATNMNDRIRQMAADRNGR